MLNQCWPGFSGFLPAHSLIGMSGKFEVQQVEVSFVGVPPARQICNAAGVSEVEVDGTKVRCLVAGSFQPFLEALKGHEVLTLLSRKIEEVEP